MALIEHNHPPRTFNCPDDCPALVAHLAPPIDRTKMTEEERREHCVHDWRMNLIGEPYGTSIDHGTGGRVFAGLRQQASWYCTRCRETHFEEVRLS